MSVKTVIIIALAALVIVAIKFLRKNKKLKFAQVDDDDTKHSSALTLDEVDSSDWAKEQESLAKLNDEQVSNKTPLDNDLQEVVNQILAIPHDYHAFNKSKFQLVMESGYAEIYEQITEMVLTDALAGQLHRINEWVQYSEDQRTSEGCFLRKETDHYCMGTFSTKDGYRETLTIYPDPKSACAAFIKREIEYSREMAEADKQRKSKKKNN
jgi:hypothetical protein